MRHALNVPCGHRHKTVLVLVSHCVWNQLCAHYKLTDLHSAPSECQAFYQQLGHHNTDPVPDPQELSLVK